MNVLIVTACPNGMVTSVLCSRLLEGAAQRLGWSTRVEVHDPQAIGSPLTAEEIAAAELVIVVKIGELDLQRFVGKRVMQSTPSKALADPQRFLREAHEQAQVLEEGATENLPAVNHAQPRLVAVTACPTGVAHTFMAAEALQQAAAQLGYRLSVETRGSVGARNLLDAADIEAADAVLLATDIEVDTERFAGKKIYRCGTGVALKQPRQTLEKALAEGAMLANGPSSKAAVSKQGEKTGPYKHLLTGVSYMLPMVVAGGLLIALSFVFALNPEPGSFAAALKMIGGQAAFALMVPVLAGYIAYSIADRPGLAPGMIGGMLANILLAGFLGGIIAGFIAGYSAKALSRWLRLPQSLEALKPILLIPLLASLFTGLVMIYIVGSPVADVMASLTVFLKDMGTTNAVLLGLVLGGMMCVDLGGPINKAAYAFSVGLLTSQTNGPMAATMAAGMVPPIGMAIATFLARHKFAQSEREAGKAAGILGLCFISEGAIPFAAKDPFRVIPASIAGGALTGALSMYFGCQLASPHGGLFVLVIPNAINHVLAYLLAIVAGSVVTGVVYALIKRPETEGMLVEVKG